MTQTSFLTRLQLLGCVAVIGIFFRLVDDRCGGPSPSVATRQRDETAFFPTPALNTSILDDLNAFIATHVRRNDVDEPYIEGHVGQLPVQMATYIELARNATSICEVGFNAGHSAAIFLQSNPRARYTGFTLDVAASRLGERFLRDRFGAARINIVYGDSKATVPNSHGIACDLAVVDGGHSLEDARRDLVNLARLTGGGGADDGTPPVTVIVDDVGCSPSFCHGPTRAWMEAIIGGSVVQHGCWGEPTRNRRGFCFGTYVQSRPLRYTEMFGDRVV